MRRRISTIALASVCALAVFLPAPAAGAVDPFFGTLFDDNANLTREQRQMDMDKQVETGLGVIRQHIFWSQIEIHETPPDQPGFFDWRALDELVSDAADRGLSVLPVIIDTPNFYKASGQSLTRPGPPEDPAHFGRFMRNLAKRYGDRGTLWCDGPLGACPIFYRPIESWQLWNEPNCPCWWKGDALPSPAEYVDLLRAGYTGLKEVNPNAEVVMAGLASTTTAEYLEGLYDAGAAPYFDTLAIHAYGADVPASEVAPRIVRQIADAHGDTDVPIWVTEYGWATGGRRSHFIKTPDCQAALLHAATLNWRRLKEPLNLRGAIQFQWRDVATTRTSWPFYAGLNPSTFLAPPKPALAELANAIASRPPDPNHSVELCPPDYTPPTPTLSPPRLSKRSMATVLTCGGEECDATHSASVWVPGRSRVFELGEDKTVVPANQTSVLKWALPRMARKAVQRAYRLGRGVRARITLRANDIAGNDASLAKTYRLKSG